MPQLINDPRLGAHDGQHPISIPENEYAPEIFMAEGGIMPAITIEFKVNGRPASLWFFANPDHIYKHADCEDAAKSTFAFELAQGELQYEGQDSISLVQVFLRLDVRAGLVYSGAVTIYSL